jgi:citrate synthase
MTNSVMDSAGPSLRSSSGIALFGDRVVVWGKDLHAECLGMSFVHYYLFCATGRWFDAERARVLERLWISTGYPDARLWCNRIAGYLGSARVDPALAVSAALAASNSSAYGFRALKMAYGLQREIPEELTQREQWVSEQLKQKRRLVGYGRPVKGEDERLAATYRILAEQQIQAGPALRRAYWLGKQLSRAKGVEMNVTAAWSAVCIDFGMTCDEFEAFMLLMLAPGYIAVYVDQRRREPLSFLSGYQSASAQPEGGALESRNDSAHRAGAVDASPR